MTDQIIDQITHLKLKLLEKVLEESLRNCVNPPHISRDGGFLQRLENERAGHDERPDSVLSTRSYGGRDEALHSALRRKRDLLRRLKEQHMLDELARPQTWAGTHRRHHYEPSSMPTPPFYIYQTPPPAPPPTPPPAHQPPRIIHHTFPHQPPTIIQQLPQQQPLIAQIPPVQPAPCRSGSIKEDMVELMLMQNAQMHQIIMHNMMLKALPPMATGASASPSVGQENHTKVRGGAVHHHHYGPPPLPPIGYSAWPSMMSVQKGGAYQPSIQHLTGPVTLPPLNTVNVDGMKMRFPVGFQESFNPFGVL